MLGSLEVDSGGRDGREQASERVRGRLLVLGHSVSSRYVCADILYDRASERAGEGA